MQLFYQLSPEDVLKKLNSREAGLSGAEVAERLRVSGKNKLEAVGKVPLVFRLLAQFKNLLAVILLVAGSLSLYLHEYRDTIIMFSIVAVNALIGFIQEYKAEKVMDALKGLVRAKAKVIRDGKTSEVDSIEVVPGDIVVLEEGDAVPADIRLLQESNLEMNDFSLTGESNPTKKFTHAIEGAVMLGDRNNIAFMGTTVATGNATGVVVATGMQTEIGRIAHLSQAVQVGLSPLQEELNHLAKRITLLTLIVAAILFPVGIYLDFSLREAFLFALGIAASCVPEGLPAQVSVALSLAAGRLAKQKAVIKKLSAVETLGATHIICTDKTGTLTGNEMTVQKFLIGKDEYEVTGVGYEPRGEIRLRGQPLSREQLANLRLFLENGVLSSNAKISGPDKEHTSWYSIGDPTEAALITLAGKGKINSVAIDKKYKELREFTFDAARKLMSSVRRREGQMIVCAKGAPRNLLDRCTRIWDGQRIRPITSRDRQKILKQNDTYASQALRILGYAYRECPEFKPGDKMGQVEQKLIWLGLVTMFDPPRPEVKAAIEAALQAQIRVIMITGDHSLTARAIAEKIGMVKIGEAREAVVITSAELHQMSDFDLSQKLARGNLIFARTSPEDKLRIVDLLKQTGKVVAVTGDGVNDAPALKKADIGVAMGKTGTEVAKDSAELILLDDSFATLVAAVQEGRTIFQNLHKTIMSSMTSNGGELFAVLLSLVGIHLFGAPLAILAVQILAIDLVGEMLPLTFLTWDAPRAEIMSSPPRDPGDHIINRNKIIDLVWSGFVMGALAYMNFLFLFFREGVSPLQIAAADPLYLRATTLTYVSIVFIQWVNILSRRAGNWDHMFTSYLWSNKRLWLGYGISLILILNIVYNPYISQFLYTGPLGLTDWAYVVLAGLAYLTYNEVWKYFRRQRRKALALESAD